MHTHILPTLSDSPDGAVKSASDFKTLVTLLIKPIIWIIQLKQISYISFLFRSGKHINICLTGLGDPSIALCALMSLHGVTVNSARNRNKQPSASTMLTPIILVFSASWWTEQFAEHLFYYKSQTHKLCLFWVEIPLSVLENFVYLLPPCK